MLIAVIGGKLQGVEVVYLAQKAGWETLVIDKNPHALATGLCDRFLEFEFSVDHPVPPACPRVDLILPALEDEGVLAALKIWSQMEHIPLAFDPDAYQISSSKLKSDALFKKMNLPAPLSWPGCPFPVVVKPDQASGSRGVEVFHDLKALSLRYQGRPKDRVIQEYVDGPSYSLEVVGSPGQYRAFQVTDLHMDHIHDCKRVTAPTRLACDKSARFEEMAIAIAAHIHLNGIMDVEVILNKNELKLLEIDARFPSQTPMAVYWSTGINLVEQLVCLFLKKEMDLGEPVQAQHVIVEHIRVSGSDIAVLGEHIMSRDGPLRLKTGFFGASEALTSFSPGKDNWVGTMIFAGISHAHVAAQRQTCYDKIQKEIHLKHREQGQ